MKELFSLNIYFKRYAGKMLIGVFCIVFSNIASVYVPVFVREGLNEAMFYLNISAGIGSSSFTEIAISASIGFGVCILMASFIRGVFMFFMRQKIIVVSRQIEFDLKNDIYRHYQKLDSAFYRKNFTGDMMARIGEDVSNVRMYVGPAVMYFVNIIFTFTAVLYQMFSINPYLSMYVLLPLPVLSYSIYKVSNLINKRTTEIQTKLSSITTFAQETFAGIRVIKSFGAERNFTHGFENENKEYRKSNLKLAVVNSFFIPLMLLLIGLSSLIVLYLGGIEAANGRFTSGNIAEFMIYINMLVWPVASLGWTTALVQKAAASQKRINAFLNTAPENLQEEGMPFKFTQEISFSNVSFRYENAKIDALHNINLTLKKGKIIGITGKTGCGKSSIVQLLMRLYEPTNGKITIDGVDLTKYQLSSYRNQVSYVPQDVFLFSETIAANIAFGSYEEDFNLAQVKEAAAFAELNADLNSLPEGIDTVLGERGVTLSGGQKQRVSISRALMRDAAIYVFDDCLSAVDATTEMKIIRTLSEQLKGKTAIIISHRVAPLAVADEIIVLANGEIIEKGTRQDLLNLKGEFAALSKMQAQDLKEFTI